MAAADDVSPESGPRVRLFDISEYGRMVEGDFFDEDSRVDLVAGNLVRADVYTSRRIDAMERIGNLLRRHDDLDVLVRVKDRIRLDWYTEMQPDVAIVADYPKVQRLYSLAPPASRDILHVIEVIDGPEAEMHAWKRYVYAQHGIARFWIVDLHEQHVVNHHGAEEEGYAVVRAYSRGETIPGLLSIDSPLSVDEILGPPNR